jgi:predicted Zn-dependent protease
MAAGCAATNVAPLGDGAGHFTLEEDEAFLWRESVEVEQAIERSGLLYDDPALETYVNAVAHRLVPAQVDADGLDIHVRVIESPHVNAFALPNGAVYVHTGVFSRMDNEAQLATMLAHEISHVTHRHALESLRSTKNKSAVLATFTTPTQHVPFGGVIQLVGALGYLTSVYGFSRQLEREADVEGLRLVAKAGYDVNEAPRLFQHLLEYQEEAESHEDQPPYFFSTHPRIQERIDSYRDLLAGQYRSEAASGDRVVNAGKFATAVHDVVVDNAEMELAIGRYRSARISVERVLAGYSDDAHALFVYGEALRLAGDDDVSKAVDAYTRAISADPRYAAPHRALGLIYYRKADRARAIEHFHAYLDLAPNAGDRAYVEGYIHDLEADAKPAAEHAQARHAPVPASLDGHHTRDRDRKVDAVEAS